MRIAPRRIRDRAEMTVVPPYAELPLLFLEAPTVVGFPTPAEVLDPCRASMQFLDDLWSCEIGQYFPGVVGGGACWLGLSYIAWFPGIVSELCRSKATV